MTPKARCEHHLDAMPCDFSTFLWLWNDTERRSTPSVHLMMSGWLDSMVAARKQGLVLLAFRGAGKSTLVGIFCAWLLLCDPERRILVLSAEHHLASKMTRHVRRVIERHPLTQGLRGGLGGHKTAESWAYDQLTVRRRYAGRDPSLIARGLTANVTGIRADMMIYDDVEVPNSCDTAVKRQDLRTRLSETAYILTPHGMQLYIGTPHCYDTIYKPLVSGTPCYLQGFERLDVPLLDAQGRSAWRERFDEKAIARLRQQTGPRRFAAQMLLCPQSPEESRLDVRGIVPYDAELTYGEALSQPVLTLGDKRLVSASCWWDPAWGGAQKNCGSVIAVLYTDEDGGLWLHGLRWLGEEKEQRTQDHEDDASRQCGEALDFLAEHYLSSVHIEVNGLGKFLPSLLRRVSQERGVMLSVIEHHSTKPKHVRILEAFDAVLAAKALHVHARVIASPFMDELRHWQAVGYKGRDDALDAVSGCLSSEPIRFNRHSFTPSKAQPRRWQGRDAVEANCAFDVMA